MGANLGANVGEYERTLPNVPKPDVPLKQALPVNGER